MTSLKPLPEIEKGTRFVWMEEIKSDRVARSFGCDGFPPIFARVVEVIQYNKDDQTFSVVHDYVTADDRGYCDIFFDEDSYQWKHALYLRGRKYLGPHVRQTVKWGKHEKTPVGRMEKRLEEVERKHMSMDLP